MEDVPDAYCAPGYDGRHPLVCMDAASKQLLADRTPPAAARPGVPGREDYHYGRNGVQAVFLFFDPIRGWRRVAVTGHRTRVDWAEQVRRLRAVDYPRAERVTRVLDNLSTHHVGSPYAAFPAAEAHAPARRLDPRPPGAGVG